MTDEQRAIYQRIEAFPIDHPEARHPFSKRLAKENRWSDAYTRRVIEEYRRFAFLFAAAGHPVSPSEDVDQAWHLHLLYSENYWDEFCGQAVGRPLHHRPSQGIQGDGAQFEDWYRNTLASYVRLFGEAPPSDIWPSPEAKRTVRTDFRRIDCDAHWVIPKPRLNRHRAATVKTRLGILFAVALLVAGCSDAVKGPNPLDWNGQDFLGLFAVLYCVCYAGGWGLRYRLRKPLPNTVPAANLGPYEVIFLLNGAQATMNAALAGLARQGAVQMDPAQGRLVSTSGSFGGASPVESHVFGSVQTGLTPGAFRTAGSQAGLVASVQQGLVDKGLIMRDDARFTAALAPLAFALLPVVLGLIKIMVGVSRDRPVGILSGLCFLGTIVALISFARRPWLSAYGAAVRADLTTRYHYLQGVTYNEMYSNGTVDSDDFLLAVGLYGADVLLGSPYAPFMGYMMPMGPMVGGGGGCNSGCNSGGSSCNSGGSSCNSGGSSCNSGGSSCSSGGGSSCSSGSSCGGGGGGCGGCSS